MKIKKHTNDYKLDLAFNMINDLSSKFNLPFRAFIILTLRLINHYKYIKNLKLKDNNE